MLDIASTIVVDYWIVAHASITDVMTLTNINRTSAASNFILTDSILSDTGTWMSSLKFLLYFFGLPMIMLLPFGIVENYHNNSLKWSIVLSAYPILLFVVILPILFSLMVLPKSQSIRHYFLLLTPFIGIHGGRAIEILATSLRLKTEPRRRMITLIGAVICLGLLIMPTIGRQGDGPVSLTGRLWNPLRWFHWQQTMASDLKRLEQIIDAANQNKRTLVLSSSANDDRYLHLRLIENGFLLSPDHNPLPGCGDGFELYHNGEHELIHIRTHNPSMLAKVPIDYMVALQIEAALKCHALFESNQFFFTGFGNFALLGIENPKGIKELYSVLFDTSAPNLQPYIEY